MKSLEEIKELNDGFFCEWTELTDVVGKKYSTSCGGTPYEFETERKPIWKFCPLCGKMLRL